MQRIVIDLYAHTSEDEIVDILRDIRDRLGIDSARYETDETTRDAVAKQTYCNVVANNNG